MNITETIKNAVFPPRTVADADAHVEACEARLRAAEDALMAEENRTTEKAVRDAHTELSLARSRADAARRREEREAEQAAAKQRAADEAELAAIVEQLEAYDPCEQAKPLTAQTLQLIAEIESTQAKASEMSKARERGREIVERLGGRMPQPLNRTYSLASVIQAHQSRLARALQEQCVGLDYMDAYRLREGTISNLHGVCEPDFTRG